MNANRRKRWHTLRALYLVLALGVAVWSVAKHDWNLLVSVAASPFIAMSAYYDWKAQRREQSL